MLGIQPPPPQIVVPRPLNLLHHQISGICAVRYHTVAWGPTGIYAWGLHAGQLGHPKNGQKYIITPKLIPNFCSADTKFADVAASTRATTFLTSKGDIYVLHEYQCRKIAAR